jgi:SAM-dependent methyltransferase
MTDNDAAMLLDPVAAFYGGLIQKHGARPAGVDWPSVDRQETRFAQFDRLFTDRPEFSILDYGCGYGGYFAYLRRSGKQPRYVGFDIAGEMIRKARELVDDNDADFVTSLPGEKIFDFVVASGIFNVKLSADVAAWEKHVLRTIEAFHTLSKKGFAFNVLSDRREPHRKMPHLYYADPSQYLRLCLEKYSHNVALLHDYDLWDFTVIVKKS